MNLSVKGRLFSGFALPLVLLVIARSPRSCARRKPALSSRPRKPRWLNFEPANVGTQLNQQRMRDALSAAAESLNQLGGPEFYDRVKTLT